MIHQKEKGAALWNTLFPQDERRRVDSPHKGLRLFAQLPRFSHQAGPKYLENKPARDVITGFHVHRLRSLAVDSICASTAAT